MSKITMAAAGTVGFLLGSRAGRGPYERVMSEVQRLRDDPEVQHRVAEARDTVAGAATDAVQTARARVDGATSGPGVATP